MGRSLAGAATLGLSIGLGRRTHASESIVASTAGAGGRSTLRTLAHLGTILFALIHLAVLSPGLLVFTRFSGIALASVSCSRSVSALASVGCSRSVSALASVSCSWPVSAGLHAIACGDAGLCLAGLFTGLAVAGGRSFKTAFVHGRAGILTGLSTLGIVPAKCLALVGAVELAAVLLAAPVVAIGNAIAMH